MEDSTFEYDTSREYKALEVSATVDGTELLNVNDFSIHVETEPNQVVIIRYDIRNITDTNIWLTGVELQNETPEFSLYTTDLQVDGWERPILLEPNRGIVGKIHVEFASGECGNHNVLWNCFFQWTDPLWGEQYDSAFRYIEILVRSDKKKALVPESPFTYLRWQQGMVFFPTTATWSYIRVPNEYRMTTLMRSAFSLDLIPERVNKMRGTSVYKQRLRTKMDEIRETFDRGLNPENYFGYWHNHLFWEFTTGSMNLQRYNMTGVSLDMPIANQYVLYVPGLAEKRPSLMRRDKVELRAMEYDEVTYEGVIKEIQDNAIVISNLHESFMDAYYQFFYFNIRFILSPLTYLRMHKAVDSVFATCQESRIFPSANPEIPPLLEIIEYFNKDIKDNPEQALAVRHILSGTSGTAPYMVFGPPGTGKTVTIVEAIVQIVLHHPGSKIMVCTDSNLAADNVALSIMKYEQLFERRGIHQYMCRNNSKNRIWELMSPLLIPVSNGSNYYDCTVMNFNDLKPYKIVVMTMQHSATYAGMPVTHLFIDEAAQSLEPNCLIPITSALSMGGSLILAGDPKQLGPICQSRAATEFGLGKSLMERLLETHPELYQDDMNYITRLKKNYRSHPDILKLSNEMFYSNSLEPAALADPVSAIRILNEEEAGEGAIVFHSVNSVEQRIGKSPSYFNEKELNILKEYVKALINKHNVQQEDIGIISPYIRQVYKMRAWLEEKHYGGIEVGTVEAFQGREKRVILISTVRANSNLINYDAKYKLGFLVDPKRFNVALTRGKAKVVIIGNTACLVKDANWRSYMDRCKELNSYLGEDYKEEAEVQEINDNEMLQQIVKDLNNLVMDV